MSQIGKSVLGSGGAVIETLTADTGTNPVGPDGAFNINVFGGANATAPSAVNIVTVGDAASNTLTVNLKDSINLPNSSVSGTYTLALNNIRFLHNYGTNNTFLGANAGNLTNTSSASLGLGASSLNSLTNGISNTGAGASSLGSLTSGDQNFAGGDNSLAFLVSGSNNVALGANSGINYTGAETANILIGNQGVLGDSLVIRIGDSQTENFQAGIYGVTPAVATPLGVVVDSAGQLGTGGGIVATQYNEDSGSAVPAAGILNIIGGASTGNSVINMNTRGSGNTVEVCLNNSISQPNTNASGTTGLYSLGGDRFLHNFDTFDFSSVYLGRNAGNLAATGGAQNIGIGYAAYSLGTNTGVRNIAIGYTAAQNMGINTSDNIAIGFESMINYATNGGGGNVGVGTQALWRLTGGSNNTGVGTNALNTITVASNNCGFGGENFSSMTTGSNNSALGFQAGKNLGTSSTNNICIGYQAGSVIGGTRNDNIMIGNVGVALDSATIRIGTVATQTKNFQAGIYAVTPAVATPQYVVIDSAGQLGSVASATPSWVDVTGTTQTIAVNTYYIADNAGLVTFTLPATAALGDEFWVAGGNAGGGWIIAQNANQAVKIGSTTSTVGVGGSIASTASTDSVRFLCTVAGASTRWTAITSMGTLAVV